MDRINITIFIIGFLNIVLGFIVLSKNQKNPNNIWFFLMCLFGGGWGVMKAIQLSVLDVAMHDLWIDRIMMFCGIVAPVAYFMLAYHFPYKLKTFSKEKLFLIFIAPVVMVILTLSGIFTYTDNYIIAGSLHREIIFWEFFIFSVYFFVYIFFGLCLLLGKYKSAERINKDQIKYLIVATISTFVFVGFCSVILLLFNIFTYDGIGALFLLIHFFVVGYLLFYKKS